MRRYLTTRVSAAAVRILHLDDDAAFAGRVRNDLAQAAWAELTFEHVATLAEALARLAQGSFDLVIAELDVGDSNGLATLERLAQARDRLIIVLTRTCRPTSTGSRTNSIASRASRATPWASSSASAASARPKAGSAGATGTATTRPRFCAFAIVPVGEWVLRRACADLKARHEPVPLAVNLWPMPLR